MFLSELNIILKVSCLTLLVLTCLLLVKYARRGLNSWTGIGLTLAIICYLLVESPYVQSVRPLYFIVVTGAISIPVFFLLLTKAIFDDHFKLTYWVVLWFLIQFIPHIHVYSREEIPFSTSQQFLFIIAEITSIGFILAGLYTAIKTKKSDLVELRLRFRNVFIVITAALIGVTLIVESLPLEGEVTLLLQVLQRSSIVGLTTYFLFNHFEIRPGFFFNEYPKEKPIASPEDETLRQKLESQLEIQKIYRKEGLTIRELAEIMNEQEYRLRRLINGQLGFKNFNDFINQYRIREACVILADPSQNRRTILEIAYELGYQSIGPFNRAFKEIKGVTPTSFRKNQQNK